MLFHKIRIINVNNIHSPLTKYHIMKVIIDMYLGINSPNMKQVLQKCNGIMKRVFN